MIASAPLTSADNHDQPVQWPGNLHSQGDQSLPWRATLQLTKNNAVKKTLLILITVNRMVVDTGALLINQTGAQMTCIDEIPGTDQH